MVELQCNARRIGHTNMQFSNTFFCPVHILGAISSLSKILVIVFYFDFLRGVVLKLHYGVFPYLNTFQNHLEMIEPSFLAVAIFQISGNGFIHMK